MNTYIAQDVLHREELTARYKLASSFYQVKERISA